MNGRRRPSVLDRALRIFADVRAGEGANVVILAVNVFLLLTAYYILKPIRDGLIIGEEGPEFAAYMSAAMAFLLNAGLIWAAVEAFHRSVGRGSRGTTVPWPWQSAKPSSRR